MCVKSCKSCPINITTEEGVIADSYGCLPTFYDAMKWYKDTGKVWACHMNTSKACGGFLIISKEEGVVIEVNNDTSLINERTTLEEIYS